MRPKVVVIVKRTAFRLFVEEEQDERITRLIKKNDPTVRRMRRSHEEHERTLAEVGGTLDRLGVSVTWVRRGHAPFDPDGAQLVITVGGDGTLLASSHRIGSTPLLGVNSAPSHSVGFFCGVKMGQVKTAIPRALEGKMKAVSLARMMVIVNGSVISTRVLNDALFCHRSPAATTRYILTFGRTVEEQKSSGFWIGPAAGSTAAQRSGGGKILPLTSKQLQFVVREPYTPEGEKLKLTRVLLPDGKEFSVRSKIREGRLFIDGPHEFADIEMGDRLVFKRSPESLTVLGLSPSRKWGRLPVNA
ncbi:MAG: NAD(+)/NADH kinase [Polyangiaceae bacterium]